jgi:hypothetical protein
MYPSFLNYNIGYEYKGYDILGVDWKGCGRN